MPARYLFLFFLLLTTLACSRPKPLVYRDVQSFRVHQADLQKATIVLDIQLYNPNNYGLTLKNGDLDAYFNDKYLGKAMLDERTAVPARDTFLLPVTLTADLSSLLANALNLLVNKNTDVLIRLQGNIRAGRGGIFLAIPVRYEGRQKIQL